MQEWGVGWTIAFAFLPLPSIFLSILGSSMILYSIVMSKKRGSFERILSLLSISDIAVTTNHLLQGFLFPLGIFFLAWPSPDRTAEYCAGLGASLQFTSIMGTHCNVMLSVYFLLVVCEGVSGERKMRRLEPWLYGTGLAVAIVTTTAGLIIHAFNKFTLSGVCHVNCIDEMDASCAKDIVPYALSLPIYVDFSIITYCMVSISRHVRKTVRQHDERSTVRAIRNSHDGFPSDDTIGNTTTGEPRYSRGDNSDVTRSVATQSILFVAASMLCYPWTVFLFVYEGYVKIDDIQTSKLLPVIILHWIFMPLQGFLNFLVFIRPHYMALRNRNSNSQSRWQTFREALRTLHREEDRKGESKTLSGTGG